MPKPPKTVEPSKQFLAFIQQQATDLRDGEPRPKSLKEWASQKRRLRRYLQRSWGAFPKTDCDLEPRKLGELKRDGYRVEKIVFQTRPRVWMTANAYVPDGDGKHPAVLCVHGHWRGAKQDPTPQARCIGLAKLGFFVLIVDAFGAGERGLGKALGEYHGEMVAATLFPTGLTLAGLQVHENMRAVDYLETRPEVDAKRIGITGASGGGNQTMYAGAYDERFKAVVPTCSVGTYQAYLGAACCMCEVVPAALTYTAEWRLLAMVAPRGLMLINATRDSFQFSVGEAAKSLAVAKTVFNLHKKPGHAKHAIFESKHDYSRPMREAMYGWMTLHLKGEGNGDPIPEPEIKTEDPEALRCYPGESRPDGFVTIPQFAAAEGRRILKNRQPPAHVEHWEAESLRMLEALVGAGATRVLGTFPSKRTTDRVEAITTVGGKSVEFTVESEPGITLDGQQEFGKGRPRRIAVLLDLDGADAAGKSDLAASLRKSGWDLVTADLRATGQSSQPGDSVGRAPDHNTAEWSMWNGRPLLGQWVWDVSRLIDSIEDIEKDPVEQFTVIGRGPAGVVAICAAILDQRITQVAAVDMLASYVSDKPYEKQRLGIMVPGILRDVGDIPHIAALVAPRRLVVAGGVKGDGTAFKANSLQQNYHYTQKVFALERASKNLVVTADNQPDKIVEQLKSPRI